MPAWKWEWIRQQELGRAGASYKSLNRRQLDEEATTILLEDCHAQEGRPGEQTKAYRKRYGIVFPEQLIKIQNREYLVATVDYIHEGTGMFWRSHPEGRTLHTPEQRAQGSSYYR